MHHFPNISIVMRAKMLHLTEIFYEIDLPCLNVTLGCYTEEKLGLGLNLLGITHNVVKLYLHIITRK